MGRVGRVICWSLLSLGNWKFAFVARLYAVWRGTERSGVGCEVIAGRVVRCSHHRH